MNRRDRNSDMEDELADIVWAPIITTPPPTPPPSTTPPPPSAHTTPPPTAHTTPPPPAHTTPPPPGPTAPPTTVTSEGPVFDSAFALGDPENSASTLPTAPGSSEKPTSGKPSAPGSSDKSPPCKPPGSEGPKGPTGSTTGKQAVASEPELAARPCEELRRRLRELKANNCERLERLRRPPDVETTPGRWLQDLDVVPGIATVALAVTAHQSWNQGFSIPSAHDLVSCNMRVTRPVAETERPNLVTRFCRPMMFPVYYGDHTVLALVQMDQNGQLSFSIFDSMASYYDEEDKNIVVDVVTTIVQDTQWWRQRYHDWDAVPKPATAQWIPCAQQPTESECGYYSMLFSWALALGLELNPHAAPVWDEHMFQEVLDVSHLARLGLVDWTLIQNFLRCHRFVLDGAVPQNRRFQRSVPLETVNALTTHLEGLAADEIINTTDPEFDIANIMGSNFILLPTGWDPTSNKFKRPSTAHKKSKEWKTDRSMRHQLMLLGHLRFGIPPATLALLKNYHLVPSEQKTKDATDFGTHEALYFQMMLRWLERTNNAHDIPHERWFTWYHLFLANERAQTRTRAQLDDEPCVLATEKLQRLRKLFKNNHINHNIGNAIPDASPGRNIDLGEINLAIAAVVEAIDQRQATLHRGNRDTFAGGFALTTSENIETAKSPSPAEGARAVSRPRRCLLLPTLIDSGSIAQVLKQKPTGRRQGHYFLAVVQEEPQTRNPWNNDPTHFVVYTLDSAPDRFRSREVQTLFNNTVRTIAENLGWSTQRNLEHQARFRAQHTQVDVFRQGLDGWQCGLHVVLNAWILALGLIPTPDPVNMDEGFYNELWLLIRSATAGLLDWQTLVAWLFCKGVTTLRTLDAVPEDRRFELSRHQDAEFGTYRGQREFRNEGELANRIQEMIVHDMLNVEPRTEEALPYDRGNNIVIPGETSGADGGESSKAKQEDSKKKTGKEKTRMILEDFLLKPRSTAYKTAQSCTEEQLETLLVGMADVHKRERDENFLALAMSMDIKVAEEGSEEESEKESEEGLNRAFDDCGVPRRGGLKRKADVKSEGSRHDGSFSTSRKRCKLNCISRRVLRSCVDADGDVRMG